MDKLDEQHTEAEIQRQKALMMAIAKPGRRSELEVPMMRREAPLRRAADAGEQAFDIVWSVGSKVRRFDWYRGRWFWEELSMDPAHVRMERFKSGRASVLNSHWATDLRDILGVIRSADVVNGQGLARIVMSSRPDVADIVEDMRNGIIGNVSVGYDVHQFEMLEPAGENDLHTYRAIDWEPMEVSLVPIGADADAGLRGKDDPRWQRCKFTDHTRASSQSSVRPLSGDPDMSILRALAKSFDIKLSNENDPKDVRLEVAEYFGLGHAATDDEIADAVASLRSEVRAPDGQVTPELRAVVTERKRVAELHKLFEMPRARSVLTPEMKERAIAEGWTRAKVADMVLDALADEGDRTAPLPGTRGGFTDDGSSSWDKAIEKRYGKR